jgi:hypothetical protein
LDPDDEDALGTVTGVGWPATTTRPSPPTVERMVPRTAVAVGTAVDEGLFECERPRRAKNVPPTAANAPKPRMSVRALRSI